MLKISQSNKQILSGIMEDYDSGMSVNAVGEDTRATSDKLSDDNFMDRDFRNKVSILFNKDGKEAEEYIRLAKEKGMTPQGFNLVYPQLVQLFKGTLASADIVLNNTMQLIQNFQSTGVSTQSNNANSEVMRNLEEIYRMLEDEYNQGSMSKSQGDKGADIIAYLEDILTISPEDAKNFNSNQMINMKQKISRNVENLIILLNSFDYTRNEKIGILLHNLSEMKHQTLGIQKQQIPPKPQTSPKQQIPQKQQTPPKQQTQSPPQSQRKSSRIQEQNPPQKK